MREFLVAQNAQRASGETPDLDVRIIATGPPELAAMVREGQFDGELYRHLSQKQLSVPPLAERRDDIPTLIDHFVQHYAMRIGKHVIGVADEAKERLCAYSWPGNARELQNVLERVVALARTPIVDVDDSLLDDSVSVGSYRLTKSSAAAGGARDRPSAASVSLAHRGA